MWRFLARLPGYNFHCYNTFRNMSKDSFPPVEASIRQKLEKRFNPAYMNVINESYMHNVPKGAETHFKVVVVSEEFENLPLIKRHRLINELLKDELQSNVHALSIVVSIKVLTRRVSDLRVSDFASKTSKSVGFHERN